MCVESTVIALTNGSARRNASTGSARRTGVSAFAAKLPWKLVWKRKYMKTAKKPICDARRTQTSVRMLLRAGMPEPGSLGSCFFFLGGAAPGGPIPSALSRYATLSFSAAAIAATSFFFGTTGAAGGAARGVSRSIAFTAPTSPVFHGIGSTSTCVDCGSCSAA